MGFRDLYLFKKMESNNFALDNLKMNLYKTSLCLILFISILVSCNQREKKEGDISLGYWMLDNGDSTVQNIIRYLGAEEYTNESYYKNGQLRARTLYTGESLMEIYCVYDTLGNKLDFGDLKNGTGNVKVFGFEGELTCKGNYINGFREGWWKEYDFRGDFTDSIFYKQGELPDLEGMKLNNY